MVDLEHKTGSAADDDVAEILPAEQLLDPDTKPDAYVGRLLDGRYRIQSLLAVGGMGRVYKAEQASLGRLVVVKILAISHAASLKDPKFQERFALEASTASRLTHTNTVTIYDFGCTSDGVYYIVMEYVEGVSLARVLRAERRLHPVRALHFARQVCRALREAHHHKIIHRDLKPSNILLIHQGDEGEAVKVLDFGLAKILSDGDSEGSHLTRVGTFIGTPEYAAPEVSQFGVADARSDIYSVGVLLYRMLVGKVPFRGPTDAATIVSAVHDPLPMISPDLNIPSRVEALVLRCLEKEPSKRFQSMDELLPSLATCMVELGVETASLLAPSMVAPSIVNLNDVKDLAAEDVELISEHPPEPQKNVMPALAMVLVMGVLVGGGLAALLMHQNQSEAPMVAQEEAVIENPPQALTEAPAAVIPSVIDAEDAPAQVEAQPQARPKAPSKAKGNPAASTRRKQPVAKKAPPKAAPSSPNIVSSVINQPPAAVNSTADPAANPYDAAAASAEKNPPAAAVPGDAGQGDEKKDNPGYKPNPFGGVN